MNPPTFQQTLHMLWTGQGLSNLLPWLPAGARTLLAVWLPVAFKVAIGLIVAGVVYRLFFSQPRNRGRHMRGSRLVIHRWPALRRAWHSISTGYGSAGWPSRASWNPCTC